ncbi:MAG: adenylate/guanylate cyclase domain-containing protein [Candidatus Binatia bacterium]
MNTAQFTDLCAWIAEAGLAGQSEAATLDGFCERALAVGLPLARANIVIDTLHPVYEGRAFVWKRKTKKTSLTEFGRGTVDVQRWENSPYYYLELSNEPVLRRRLTAETEKEFSVFPELRREGMTDYLAITNRFAADGIVGEMDCVYSSWATDGPAGFSDADAADLCRLMPLLALTLKAASLARIAGTLVETYLGRDAGHRVLAGRIARGVTDQIVAVLWFSDLRSYTRISDSAAPEDIIPMLNAYAGAIISAIHDRGGDVLKLIGDGTLAIFPVEDRGEACRAALAAAEAARRAVAAVSMQRAQANLPMTDMYLGLHIGEVFYGNIGSEDRLDFTVVGPAVNEVSRIASMCRSVDQPLLLSSAFATALGQPNHRLVSVGRYALRGVARAQDLFTLEELSNVDRGDC